MTDDKKAFGIGTQGLRIGVRVKVLGAFGEIFINVIIVVGLMSHLILLNVSNGLLVTKGNIKDSALLKMTKGVLLFYGKVRHLQDYDGKNKGGQRKERSKNVSNFFYRSKGLFELIR